MRAPLTKYIYTHILFLAEGKLVARNETAKKDLCCFLLNFEPQEYIQKN